MKILNLLLVLACISFARESVDMTTVNGQKVSIKVSDVIETAATLKSAPNSVAGKVTLDSSGQIGVITDIHFIISGKKYALKQGHCNRSSEHLCKEMGNIICKKFGFNSSLGRKYFSSPGSSKEMESYERTFGLRGYSYLTVNELEEDGTPNSIGESASVNILKSVTCRY
ncbi:MAG: hypothetical protein ACK5V3_12320 [Bdellovibrionales bacterium]